MKSIGINNNVHKEIKSLCKAHKKGIGEFISDAVLYFKQTGIYPEQHSVESPQKSIKELSKRVEQIIGVIKAQEQDKMNPLLETLMMLTRRAEMILSDAPKETTFKTVLHKLENMMEADQKQHIEQLKTQHKYYKEQSQYLQKNHEQSYAEVVKKMNEVVSNMDKMTVLLESSLDKK